MKKQSSRKYKYPYLNPNLPIEERIDDLIGRMTLDEKIQLLGSGPGTRVPRSASTASSTLKASTAWPSAARATGAGRPPSPPPPSARRSAWARPGTPMRCKQVAEIEAEEVRYCYQSPKYQRGGLVVRAPNADIGRDIRWGRTEECYGEDAWFNGTMTVAFVKGLQGDHPRYWKTASLMKHFCANSNEDTREHSSSDFDARLFHEYYSLPFRMGVMEGGSRAYMAAYNSVNGIPCTVHPMLKDITVKQWGQDGIICTDGGALRLLISAHKYYPTLAQGAAWSVKMGITQFLDRYHGGDPGSPAEGLPHRSRHQRIDPRQLPRDDPPGRARSRRTRCPTARSAPAPSPGPAKRHKRSSARSRANPSSCSRTAAACCPWIARAPSPSPWSGSMPTASSSTGTAARPHTPSARSKASAPRPAPKIAVSYSPDNTNDAAVEFARSADVAIVIVGNHPTCNAGWAKTVLPSDGKEAVDRKSITLEHEELIKQVYKANPRTDRRAASPASPTPSTGRRRTSRPFST